MLTGKGGLEMKITMIHGQSHQGSTCHVARMLAEKLDGEVTEFFLPRDFGAFCAGCNTCFGKSETLCPHYEALKPITAALDEADVIILASPVYVYHATGPMKTLLDHYGWRWMVHRPEAAMFRKQGVCISTAAGAGMKSTNKDMADSLFYWGVARTYRLGAAVRAVDWDRVDPRIKEKLNRETDRLAKTISVRQGRVTPGLKTKGFFNIMRLLHKKDWNQADMDYWEKQGWHGKARPWK